MVPTRAEPPAGEDASGPTASGPPSASPVRSSPSVRVRHLDHTADVGFEVRAPDPEALLETAVHAMTGLILGEARPRPEFERVVHAEGDALAHRLRNLLREVLFLHEAEGFAVAEVQVRSEPGTGGAVARLRGGPDPDRPHRELKGVTLHGLEAEPDGEGGWRARVIFDV